jgi:hypothetical protein
MALLHPVYKINIHGPGRGYHQAFAALEETVHLPVSSGYLVLGDEARASIMRHDHEGDVRITAVLAGPADVPVEDQTETDPTEIEPFITAIAGAPFRWHEDTLTWSLPGYVTDGQDTSAATHLAASLAALSTVLATQKR